MQEYKQEENAAVRLIYGAIILCAVLIFILCIITTNAIVHPIKKLAAAADRLAEGELDVEIDTSGRDEVAGLARSIFHIEQ